MHQYITYIEKTLHVDVDIHPYNKTDSLPLYLSGGYEIFTLSFQNVRCLLAKPREQMNLTVMRKQCGQLKKHTGMDCVLCLESAGTYTKEKMLSEGIPFIIAGQQIYMPFMGIALNKKDEREILKVEKISFITQKLLLTAIYQKWQKLSLTEVAKNLNMSKMTITRCFDELQSLDLSIIKTEGKMRCFVWEENSRSLWDKVFLFLRNPVSLQFGLANTISTEGMKLGGLSAICHYSMLADNPCTVYATTKETAKMINITKQPTVPDNETPAIIVQVMNYDMSYHSNTAIDPLTAILSLSDEEKDDPRVGLSIDEILEECLHG